MVQLTDFSSLRKPADEKVTIPLNGVNYHAVAEIAADVMLAAAAASIDVEGLADVPAGTTMDNLDKLADSNPVLAAKLGQAGMSMVERAQRFMIAVLEPDSLQQWLTNIKPPEPGLTPAKRKTHLARMITLPQMLAVFKALLAHYGGRPTQPSDSSQNGAGGTGGNSTETVPAAG